MLCIAGDFLLYFHGCQSTSRRYAAWFSAVPWSMMAATGCLARVLSNMLIQRGISVTLNADDTQDPAEDEQQLERVKDWIGSYHLDTVEVTDVLSNFPDISVVLIEEIMDKLVKESFLSKGDGESYVMNKKKKFDYEFDAVKEEVDGQMAAHNGKPGNMSVHHMYMKALYHTLPLDYITVPKLQNKLEGEVSQTTIRKLIDKMTQDGFVEAGSNRRLGKRVIHSDLTKKKLTEVKKLLTTDAMEHVKGRLFHLSCYCDA